MQLLTFLLYESFGTVTIYMCYKVINDNNQIQWDLYVFSYILCIMYSQFIRYSTVCWYVCVDVITKHYQSKDDMSLLPANMLSRSTAIK